MTRLSSERQLGRREFVGLAAGAFLVAAIPLSRRRPAELIRRSMPVMGTIADFAVVHRNPAIAHAAIDAAMLELRRVERTMTRFNNVSDIGRANIRASRDGITVSRETALVTAEALRWAHATDGRYDPAVGTLSALWDVTHRHEPPAEDRIAVLAGRQFYRLVEVGSFAGASALRFHDGNVRLDLGSIAKGYAVDRAVDALRRKGISKGLVVAGGDLYALGSGPDDEPWSVGIQSPTDNRRMAGVLQLADRAVATSGTYQQFFRHRGRRYHHLIDPVTGHPRETTMQSLSITAATVMEADVAATALYGLSPSMITAGLAVHAPDAELARAI